MTKRLIASILAFSFVVLFYQCAEKKETVASPVEDKPYYGGFDSQEKWGEHLIKTNACDDCHTPKKMTPMGPVSDTSLWLSGHPEKMPPPEFDRKMFETKGLVGTQTLTAWVGPWGISYSANLTSDPETGIGNWKVDNFFRALREGKSKGLAASRMLLPPMPWQSFGLKTDDELKAMFAYLMTTKPIKNAVPPPVPPVSAVGKP